jgi:hypothetical protein
MSSTEALARAESSTLSESTPAARFTLWLRDNNAVRWARKLAPFAASLFGAWLCFRFCSALDLHLLAGDVRRVGAGAALVVLAPFVANFVHMLGWRALLPPNARPPLRRSLAIFLAAQAGNELGAGVLGEPLKVSELPRSDRESALRAVLIDNLISLAALFAVVLSIALCLGGLALPIRLPGPIAVALLVVAGIAALALLVVSQRKARNSRGVFLSFAAHYLGKLWIIVEFALLLALLGTVTLRSSALLGLVSTLASAVGSAIPGQLGVLEAALKGSAASAGIGVATLVSVALLRRARSVLWVALGALLFWQLRSRRVASSAAALK